MINNIKKREVCQVILDAFYGKSPVEVRFAITEQEKVSQVAHLVGFVLYLYDEMSE